MTDFGQPRPFLDSNIFVDAFKSKFGLSKAIISLAWTNLVRLVVGEVTLEEVQDELLRYAEKLSANEANELLEDWTEFMKRASPEVIPQASKDDIARNRHLIRHLSDVPVLLAAITAQPDWLLTRNRNHFTDEVAEACGIRIADPEEWFAHLISTAQT
jgi:predicted nucleic acid-binding protein